MSAKVSKIYIAKGPISLSNNTIDCRLQGTLLLVFEQKRQITVLEMNDLLLPWRKRILSMSCHSLTNQTLLMPAVEDYGQACGWVGWDKGSV